MKYDFGFIAIGDEITDGDIINSNSANFAKILVNQDFNVGFHICCKDSEQDVLKSIDFLLTEHKHIITIGGLGPTEDDLTTEIVAKYFNKDMLLDQSSWKILEKKMIAKYGHVTIGTKKQAMFPNGSEIIINNNGTANGFHLNFAKDRHIYAFPGPPRECIPMLESLKLCNKPQKSIIRKNWYVHNIGESLLAEKLQVIKAKYPFITFKYRLTETNIELKYFYPINCPHSDDVIKDIESLLKEYL